MKKCYNSGKSLSSEKGTRLLCHSDRQLYDLKRNAKINFPGQEGVCDCAMRLHIAPILWKKNSGRSCKCVRPLVHVWLRFIPTSSSIQTCCKSSTQVSCTSIQTQIYVLTHVRIAICWTLCCWRWSSWSYLILPCMATISCFTYVTFILVMDWDAVRWNISVAYAHRYPLSIFESVPSPRWGVSVGLGLLNKAPTPQIELWKIINSEVFVKL